MRPQRLQCLLRSFTLLFRTVTEPPFDIGSGPEDFPLPFGDVPLIDAIGEHCERYLGPCDIVNHEIVSEFVHIDLHRFPPGGDRSFWTFVTSGMAEKPMNVPESVPDRERRRFAELMLHLPVSWPVEHDELQIEENWWPLRCLKQFARLPHEHEAWVGQGHTMASDPPMPYASNTEYCAVVLWPSFHMPHEFRTVGTPDGREITIFTLSFLYREELEFKSEHGMNALVDKFDKAGLD